MINAQHPRVNTSCSARPDLRFPAGLLPLGCAHPAADPAAVEGYAYQLFVQAAEEAARVAVRRAAAPAPSRAASNPIPVPLAYQLWLSHLLWLEEVVHTLDCHPGDIAAAELAGLQALNRARARFLREHQFCSRCQAANPRFASRCRRCAQEL